MKLPFYRAFEERYYAPREYILELRRQYLPYVSAVVSHSKTACAIDVGCGRGEWLELMGQIGVSAFGVDLDEGMLKDCQDRGLNAKLEEGLSALRKIPDQSQSVVSAFHVAEHLAFEDLRLLIAEAYRVLAPGGLIILETPNPENLLVGTKNFYLDPTHQRPLPSELLSFAVEYSDFAHVTVLRLQEPSDILSKNEVNLHDVFGGASPDYAVIGQKGGFPDSIRSIAHIAAPSRGASLSEVSAFYDAKMEQKLKALEAQDKKLLAQARQTTATVDFLSRRIEITSTELSSLRAELAASRALAKAQTDQLLAVYESSSWKVTAPLRMARSFPRRFVSAVREGRVKSAFKRRVKNSLIKAAGVVNRNPQVAAFVSSALNRFPGVKKRMGRVLGVRKKDAVYAIDPKYFSPEVQEIYSALKNRAGSVNENSD